MCSFYRARNFVAGYVYQSMILGAAGHAFLVFIESMKGCPDSAIFFSVTQKHYFFRRHVGDSKRIEKINQLAEALTIDESSEESWTFRRIKIRQRAQLAIVAQSLP